MANILGRPPRAFAGLVLPASLLVSCGDPASDPPEAVGSSTGAYDDTEPSAPDAGSSGGNDDPDDGTEDGDASTDDDGDDDDDGSDGGPDDPEPTDELPVDPEHIATVCDRNAQDPVALRLCAVEPAAIDSIESLLEALGLVHGERGFAANVNSSSLASRLTTSLNPRVLVFPLEHDPWNFQVFAFARGEALVELAAWDPVAEQLNFYAIPFARSCDADESCGVADLVTERIETNWTAWSLYQDVDLVNKTVDCLVCHQPFGPNTYRILRMQEFDDPWLHWFPGGTAGELIPERDTVRQRFLDAHAGEATYAGLTLAELASGPSKLGFLTGPEALENRVLPGYQALLGVVGSTAPFEVGMQPTVFDSSSILGDPTVWETYYADVVAGERIPIPSHAFDPADPDLRSAAADSLIAFTEGTLTDEELLDPRALLTEAAQHDLSFVPPPEQSAPELFTHFCRRCHNSQLDQTLSRARFNVDTIGALDEAERLVVIDRLQRPHGSRWIMPPERAAELPPWASDAMVAHIEELD